MYIYIIVLLIVPFIVCQVLLIVDFAKLIDLEYIEIPYMQIPYMKCDPHKIVI